MREQQDKGTGRRLLERANRQFGLLRYQELREAGLGATTIGRWTAAGRLTRLHRGVYALGHTALLPRARWLGAQWACGDGAVVSHLSACAFHGWTPDDTDAPVHVSTGRSIKSRDGIAVHRVRRLEAVDVHRAHPIAVTTIPRTLVDLADVLSWHEFRAVADRLPHLRLDKVREAQARAPFRVGSPLVTRLLEADDAHTRSVFERRYLRFTAAHGLPRPDALNVEVAGHRADCVHRTAALVVELDGRAHHERRAQMRADRLRDADYQAAGLRILRLVWDDLHPDEQSRTADRVRRLLAR